MTKRQNVIMIMLVFLICLNSSCQTVKTLTFDSLRKELILFLVKNKDINNSEVEDYYSGKRQVSINGVQNDYHEGYLKDGIYSFYQTRTHSKVYFVIIEKSNFTILDLSNREGLDVAIKTTLDFCERREYCEEITNDYISRMIRLFYRKNKNPTVGTDTNCLYGVNSKKDLP